MVQWQRLCAPKAEGLGLISGRGTRSHMLQLRIRMLQQKILHAATKIEDSAWKTKAHHRQVNKYTFF